ncbi:bifunctional diguanylate cyclase/phosphodiesterase [Stenotrophomonas maltophilia]|uniref:putative bifunctional diguanylate cyclase/phosphodiesterase n=1 Tax=Stenotrophomonas maltophilia TaxID=40324 RepID=UPI0015DF592A|nr:bifunctional diguanylate cyclase/phosphodiesterase [Stenotrophomonas maltophilia]MBA0386482.1 bifunctional diguanylate cyclase/phosphodiesterase [Stenotrophomonas maltophilia]MBA0391870.1 bifunctional diguanylate cyclase/phosphodiesterase [Stenotrophomonas maltophilia]MBA0464314.1 bifunctional diguanylate cyclase/phosphodiesterase [Stenotrophomonas maltophilia]MBA0471692.1 bifunctional diguanylate cyclase/phosphodiesterase [Stenotrophomonas maltophilia]
MQTMTEVLTSGIILASNPVAYALVQLETTHVVALGGLLSALLCLSLVFALWLRQNPRPQHAWLAAISAESNLPGPGSSSPALQDALTGLPVRMMLEQSLRLPKSRHGRIAVLVIGMDGFRAINQIHGHAFGDDLLRQAALRIQSCIRQQDLIVRLAGDEFALMMRVEESSHAKVVAKRLLQGMHHPFMVRHTEIDVSASIGIAVDTATGTQRNRLLTQASTALREAKDLGRNRFSVFDASMGASVSEIELMVGDLRKALREDELFLLYQPKLDLQAGRMVGVEALLRWNHPEHGQIVPDYFIPLAEKTGMIVEIGRWALHAACRQMRLWRDEQALDWSVAVNASMFQINSPAFFTDVCEALERHDINPEHLTIEVTESGAMRNAEFSLMVLRKLASIGVRISLDDFGVGHSSLTHLKRFPIHELKIDRSFVSGVAENTEDAAIVKAIIALAKAVGLWVVAEGVETTAQQAALAEMGCDAIQGYLISRPVEAGEITSIMSSYNRRQREIDDLLFGA